MKRTTCGGFAAIRSVLIFGLILVSLLGLFVAPSSAALLTLTDDNSSTQFDTASPANAFNWTVDGVNQLVQQAFWYRIGNVAEQSVHTLPIGVQGTTDANFDGNPDTLFVRYLGNGYKIETRYTLDGGTPGSGASDMGEQISITNSLDSPLDFHFFQYSDFDLQGIALGDSAVFTNPNTVRQSKAAIRLTESVVTPVPQHREINFFPVTLNKLNDGLPTTLNDAPPIGTTLGPGDMTWAYQWDVVIAPGATFQISKDKNLSAVPEPSTMFLLSAGVALIFAMRRKRSA
jgi:PEP-CTERM motif-containing protein